MDEAEAVFEEGAVFVEFEDLLGVGVGGVGLREGEDVLEDLGRGGEVEGFDVELSMRSLEDEVVRRRIEERRDVERERGGNLGLGGGRGGRGRDLGDGGSGRHAEMDDWREMSLEEKEESSSRKGRGRARPSLVRNAHPLQDLTLRKDTYRNFKPRCIS